LPPIHSEEDAPLNFLPQNNDCSQIDEFANDKVTFRELLLHLLAFCPRAKFAPMIDRLFGRYVLQIVRKARNYKWDYSNESPLAKLSPFITHQTNFNDINSKLKSMLLAI
jgi:hypothetical protein